MNKLTFFLIFAIAFLFQACSQKQYFEPEQTQSHYMDIYDLGSKIVDINSDGATLKDNTFVSKDGPSSKTLQEGFRFLNANENIILSTNDEGVILINDNGKIEKIKFDKNIISASIEKDLIAFGSIDNSISLYDRKTKKTLFKEYQKQSLLNDIKITNPIFLNSLILFPTLDGKVIIVDKAKKTLYKTINIDPSSEINNIIYLKAIGNTLVAATPKKVFSFVDGKVNTIEHNVKAVAVGDGNVFVATLEGEIIKYNEKLNRLKSKKFRFAKFYTMAYSKYLYALESQGYLIKLDNSLTNVEILDFSFDEEEKVITIDNKIYFDDSYIVLQ